MGTSYQKQCCEKPYRDHPHAYGDKKIPLFVKRSCLGSSPRVWGQADKVDYENFYDRIIPTRMGTSSITARFPEMRWDHPHAYGDKFNVDEVLSLVEGSSPRVWGQVKFCGTADKNTGIIPTRMGTSCRTNVTHSVIKDHPHAYGDKLSCLCLGCRVAGSSPRVWGQAAVTKANMEEIGIIPTRMGTSIFPCGYRSGLHGSSPRVWGQEYSSTYPASSPGIIPTRMGTSSVFAFCPGDSGDHPHAYGDKSPTKPPYTHVSGSSPRVWGQDTGKGYVPNRPGIIPTRMGTSPLLIHILPPSQDHPHAYGDKFTQFPFPFRWRGSSPRVWGQEVNMLSESEMNGIIPTRMGTSHIRAAVSFRNEDHPHAYGDKTKEIKENSGFAKSTA